MRADQIEALQDSIYDDDLGLAEQWVVTPADGRAQFEATGVWMPAGSADAGTDDVDLKTEADQVSFRRRDSRVVEAVQPGATLTRVDTGADYVVQGVAALESEQHRVTVTESGR